MFTMLLPLIAFAQVDLQTANNLNEVILPIPSRKPLVPSERKKAFLGQRLFMDRQLSKDKTISCFDCHNVFQGGDDGRKVSLGVNGAKGSINSPTVINSSLNFRQFWDGRAADLREQADGPIHNPAEMASSAGLVVERLKKDREYVRLFTEVYDDGIQWKNVKDAIVFYEGTLTTPGSPFDRYLSGDKNAISADAKKGFDRFVSFGCIACHQGANVGGNMYQTMGVARDYFAERGNIQKSDLGRFNVTGLAEDRHVFKVPSLRNVTLTGPYFHDGSVEKLGDAVRVMGRYQLGRNISDQDVDYIVKFLNSLRGPQPKLLKETEGRP